MVFESYCGHSFWDPTISWDAPHPVFSPCFSETVILWIAAAFLWIPAPFALYQTFKTSNPSLPWTFRLCTRLFLSLVLCTVSAIEFIRALISFKSVPVNQYEYYSPLISFLTFALASFLTLVYQIKGVHTSSIIFLFWSICLIKSAINYWTVIDSVQHPGTRTWSFDLTDLVIKSINTACIFLVWILNFIADTRDYGKHKTVLEKECPYISASFISRLTFLWYDSMARLGYKKSLVQADMWDLPEESQTEYIQDNFGKLLKSSTKCVTLPSDNSAVTGKTSMNGVRPAKGQVKMKINLLTVLIKAFWPWIVSCACFKFVSSMLTFASPQLMDSLLTFVASDAPLWQGVILALGMFLATFCQSMIDSQYEFWIQTVSMRMRSAIIASIYQKSLKLSSLGRRDYTTGEIVNLMAVDTQRVVEYVNVVNIIWTAPIQIVVTIVLLWKQLGIASISGLTVMVALIPFNGFITTKIKNLQLSVMKEKDKRAKMMSEVLNGMKVLKLYAWEGAFGDKVSEIRAREIRALKKQAIWSAGVTFAFACAPFIVTLVCFATFIFIDPANVLDANKAFVTITLINILRGPLAFLPMVVTYGANFIISVRRITKYLEGDELDFDAISHEVKPEIPIHARNATFSWSRDEDSALRDINITVKKNKLVAVVGTVGSGKSSLLSALLGDLYKKDGYVNVYGKIAFVPQSAWIQNATVRDNILFGELYRKEKYDRVIEACALAPDMKILTGGDQTEIGERGINVSGGQKQRISIARAVYSNSDIYLLDDPLSAVDAHVASHLFSKVIGPKGILRSKTRVLVTHRITFLPQVDEIIVMKDGKIYESGTYHELMAKKGEFADFIVQYLAEREEEGALEGEDPNVVAQIKEKVKPELEKRRSLAKMDSVISIGALSRRNRGVSKDRTVKRLSKSLSGNSQGDEENFKLVEAETAETGSVKARVYIDYIKAVGLIGVIFNLLLYVTSSSFNFGTNLWLTAWSDDSLDPVRVNDTALRNQRLGFYALLGFAESAATLGNSVISNLIFITGAQLIHNQMLYRIIRAPMSFFDTTPLGRILNRFTKDIDTADLTIGFNIRFFISQAFRASISIVGICTETGYLIIAIVITGVFYVFIQKFYIASSRQLRRIESVTRSPIYTHFSETVSGTTVIRAYDASDRFTQECFRRVDINHSSFFPNVVASRWLAVRLEILGNLIVTLAAVFAAVSRGILSPGSTGLSISYSMQITMILNMMVRGVSDVETNIVAIERCLEYTKIETESEWVNEKHRPRKEWPDSGQIEFKKYSTRYREGLDLVLKQISCLINPKEKVGIVGRTGAGKSSLTLALFRLIEPVNGEISIDKENISKLGLHDLRSRLTVIPQDPVLFSASFRSNFDPFEKHSDAEIWKALEQANLKDFVSSLKGGLDYQIAEGGENLSVGQRQLVCLTRALLRKTKVLVLDEATAAVDVETDELIQETIRREFSDCTIVTIAHRLNTIIDYDKIMVMDKGQIVEYDSPTNLLANNRTLFYSMAKEAKLV